MEEIQDEQQKHNGNEKFEIKEKIYEMILYGNPKLTDFPKTERYVLASDIRQSMYTALELAVRLEKKYYKKTTLQDLDIEIAEDTIIMIGTEGEVYPSTRAKFENGYEKSDEPYVYPGEYQPSIKNNLEGVNVHITAYARSCKPSGKLFIYTRILDHRVKVFNRWDEDKYYIGNVGDVLAVRCDDLHDGYIINGEIFKTGDERVE